MAKNNLNLNINKDDSNINDYLFCWGEFNSRPNKTTVHNSYLTKPFIDYITDLVKESNIFTEIVPSNEDYIINDKSLIKIDDTIYLAYVTIDKNHLDSMVSDLVFYFKNEDDRDKVSEIINDLEECVVDFTEDEINKFNSIVLSSSSGLDLETLESNIDLDSIELFYSSKTKKNIAKLIKTIKKSDKGLSILYGERGTGKSSMIVNIANKLDRVVMFIQNNMIEHTINNPDFRKFLKRYHKPIIVLDDCEMLFSDYFNKSNMTVNNLLQMVDGLNSLDLNIITIFNTDDEEDIDSNLLDSNNLLDVIEFDYLDKDEANELASHLGDKTKHKNKIKLIDIIRKRSDRELKKIGF